MQVFSQFLGSFSSGFFVLVSLNGAFISAVGNEFTLHEVHRYSVSAKKAVNFNFRYGFLQAFCFCHNVLLINSALLDLSESNYKILLNAHKVSSSFSFLLVLCIEMECPPPAIMCCCP